MAKPHRWSSPHQVTVTKTQVTTGETTVDRVPQEDFAALVRGLEAAQGDKDHRPDGSAAREELYGGKPAEYCILHAATERILHDCSILIKITYTAGRIPKCSPLNYALWCLLSCNRSPRQCVCTVCSRSQCVCSGGQPGEVPGGHAGDDLGLPRHEGLPRGRPPLPQVRQICMEQPDRVLPLAANLNSCKHLHHCDR